MWPFYLRRVVVQSSLGPRKLLCFLWLLTAVASYTCCPHDVSHRGGCGGGTTPAFAVAKTCLLGNGMLICSHYPLLEWFCSLGCDAPLPPDSFPPRLAGSVPIWLLLLLCVGLIVMTILLLQRAFPAFL